MHIRALINRGVFNSPFFMPMLKSLDHYTLKGWQRIEGYLTVDEVNIIKDIGEQMRIDCSKYSDWKGISCAGKYNDTLMSFYTSDKMRELSRRILGDRVYLFNDQIVIKLPGQGNTFHRSFRNQTDRSRGLYACVYTEKPIRLDGFYTREFR